MASDTRTNLLKAAHSVVQAKGVVNLTLEEVARVAAVSKGGLLYHFPSKDLLLQSMLDSALAAFEVELERQRGNDRTPGSWLRAYIHASFPDRKEGPSDSSMVGSALLASLGTDSSLAEPYARHLRGWIEHATSDGLEPSVAQTIRLAVDGLWLHDSLGLSPYTEEQRKALIAAMVRMASPPVATGARRASTPRTARPALASAR